MNPTSIVSYLNASLNEYIYRKIVKLIQKHKLQYSWFRKVVYSMQTSRKLRIHTAETQLNTLWEQGSSLFGVGMLLLSVQLFLCRFVLICCLCSAENTHCVSLFVLPSFHLQIPVDLFHVIHQQLVVFAPKKCCGKKDQIKFIISPRSYLFQF